MNVLSMIAFKSRSRWCQERDAAISEQTKAFKKFLFQICTKLGSSRCVFLVNSMILMSRSFGIPLVVVSYLNR